VIDWRITYGVRRVLLEEDGPTATEYAVLLAMVAVVGATALLGIGDTLGTLFAGATDGVSTATGVMHSPADVTISQGGPSRWVVSD